MQLLPETEAALLLRLRLAEAEILCRECEEIVEDNANVELQVLASDMRQNTLG